MTFINVPEAAHMFVHNWNRDRDNSPKELAEAPAVFHEWCESEGIPAEYRNAIWQYVAEALGVERPK